jgi:hypothetical protein
VSAIIGADELTASSLASNGLCLTRFGHVPMLCGLDAGWSRSRGTRRPAGSVIEVKAAPLFDSTSSCRSTLAGRAHAEVGGPT